MQTCDDLEERLAELEGAKKGVSKDSRRQVLLPIARGECVASGLVGKLTLKLLSLREGAQLLTRLRFTPNDSGAEDSARSSKSRARE